MSQPTPAPPKRGPLLQTLSPQVPLLGGVKGWVHGPAARLSLALLVLLFCLLGRVCAAELAELKVLYIGEPESQRAREFTGFLKINVGKVEAAARRGFNPKQAEGFDVVLLEWPQSGGNDFPPKTSPLGDRETWTKPSVLLGSAGLHSAIVWKLKGGSG